MKIYYKRLDKVDSSLSSKFIIDILNLYGIKNPIIEKEINGKPYLVNQPSESLLHFNISYDKNYIIGVIHDEKVGIDILKIRDKVPNYEKYHKYICIDEIYRIKSAVDNYDYCYIFCENWAIRQSYAKYIGYDVKSTMRMLNVKINGSHFEVYNNGIKQDTDTIISHKIKNYVIAITSRKINKIEFIEI